MATTVGKSPALLDAFKTAVEAADADALIAMYDDHAEIEMINRNSPPANPRMLRGKAEFAPYFRDVYGRDMKHSIEHEVMNGDRGAFVERCLYPDGTRVAAASAITLKDGRITHQVTVEAWDG